MRIEVWSDIVCPWCYIGKRRLETAITGFNHPVEIAWRSFELDPSAPRTSKYPLDEALARKYGMSIRRARQMMDQVTATAAEEGLEFDFSKAKGGNTFDAHRLLHFAAQKGVQNAMKERLLRAYFSEGRAISDRQELATLAADVGLSADQARAALDDGDFAAEVRNDEARARELGVRGVPYFLIDEHFALSGAQPADVIVAELRRAQAQKGSGSGGDDTSCEDGFCSIE